MKKIFVHVLAVVGVVALVVGGFRLWQMRPWRVIASVNGHAITASELELRAQTLLNDARRVENLVVPVGREKETLDYFRRRATQMWIVKEVLLAEALAQGYEVTPADEKDSLVQMTARLKSRQLTPEQFFKEGPIPEELKRRDFREGVLINKFTAKEVRDKITIDKKEIEEEFVLLQKKALLDGRPQAKISRKDALDSLHAKRFRQGFRKLFRERYAKTQVKSPEYPEMETLEGVSPSRDEDRPRMPQPAPVAKPAAAVPAASAAPAAPAKGPVPAVKPAAPVAPASKAVKPAAPVAPASKAAK